MDLFCTSCHSLNRSSRLHRNGGSRQRPQLSTKRNRPEGFSTCGVAEVQQNPHTVRKRTRLRLNLHQWLYLVNYLRISTTQDYCYHKTVRLIQLKVSTIWGVNFLPQTSELLWCQLFLVNGACLSMIWFPLQPNGLVRDSRDLSELPLRIRQKFPDPNEKRSTWMDRCKHWIWWEYFEIAQVSGANDWLFWFQCAENVHARLFHQSE